jgi:hypothetical protein
MLNKQIKPSSSAFFYFIHPKASKVAPCSVYYLAVADKQIVPTCGEISTEIQSKRIEIFIESD